METPRSVGGGGGGGGDWVQVGAEVFGCGWLISDVAFVALECSKFKSCSNHTGEDENCKTPFYKACAHFVNVYFRCLVRGRSTLRNPVCCIFFLCVRFLKDAVFLISSWNTVRSRAARSSQD